MASKPWSSIAPPSEFHPYIPSEKVIPEFTRRAIILGAFSRLVFSARSRFTWACVPG